MRPDGATRARTGVGISGKHAGEPKIPRLWQYFALFRDFPAECEHYWPNMFSRPAEAPITPLKLTWPRLSVALPAIPTRRKRVDHLHAYALPYRSATTQLWAQASFPWKPSRITRSMRTNFAPKASRPIFWTDRRRTPSTEKFFRDFRPRVGRPAVPLGPCVYSLGHRSEAAGPMPNQVCKSNPTRASRSSLE